MECKKAGSVFGGELQHVKDRSTSSDASSHLLGHLPLGLKVRIVSGVITADPSVWVSREQTNYLCVVTKQTLSHLFSSEKDILYLTASKHDLY